MMGFCLTKRVEADMGRWQIVDQSCVAGEGSEREMGFISSEPSLQEFMPHQLDSADNTPPPTGTEIISTQ